MHKEHFDQDSDDTEWIPVCAANGWVILTGDKGIENVGINRAAVIASAAKVFVLSDHRTRGLEQTAALITAHRKIGRIALENIGPFYCTIRMTGDSHVGKPRFERGGQALRTPIPKSGAPASEPASNSVGKANTTDSVPRTDDLDFGES